MHRHTPNRCEIRLREMQSIARRHGGRCLSSEYLHRHVHMEFKCREGHVWKALPQSILHGHWCRTCAYVPRDGLKQIRAAARERGGRCLSDTYVADHPGMQFVCAKGHLFRVTAKNIRRGSWCRECPAAKRRTVADMQAIADRYGGKFVSRTYQGFDVCHTWSCTEGHRFSIRPRCVRQGQWCPVCIKPETSLDRALAFAAAKGGAAVTRGRVTAHQSVRWRCAVGHTWTSDPYRLARGTWCPWCTGRLPTIERMQALAAARDGRCLSDKYIDQDTKLLWECEKGHQWWTRPASVRGGSWCPQCAWDENAARMRSEAKDCR